jgi:hypothetical protein
LPREIIKLVPNVPVEVALQYPTGKLVNGQYGDQVMFSLSENRVIYLDLGPAQMVGELGVSPGETFMVISRWTGKKDDRRTFDCWLSPATEKARAARELAAANPENELQAQMQASIRLAQSRKAAASASAPLPGMDGRGTGTHGPAPAPAPRPVTQMPGPAQIPTKRQYADAFALFLVDAGRATRSAELALGGEGGSVRFDNRDVAAIATSMFIQAAKDGFLVWDGGSK